MQRKEKVETEYSSCFIRKAYFEKKAIFRFTRFREKCRFALDSFSNEQSAIHEVC